MIFPNKYRPKPRITVIKPLTRGNLRTWCCRGGTIFGYGKSPQEAYYEWLDNYNYLWNNK